MGWSFLPSIARLMAQEPACEFARDPDHECSGRLEWHHVITKNRLKHKFPYGAVYDEPLGLWRPLKRVEFMDFPEWRCRPLNDIIGDTRNRMWLCAEGAHEPVTNARVHVVVPESVWAFARELGLVGMLENDLARQR